MDLEKRITIALLFVFILGVGIFTLGKKIAGFKDVRLAGVELRGELPRISLKSFWRGEFQAGLDKWVATTLGLRGAFVRIDNQINLTFFNEISSKYESKIVLGKDRWLYEKGYIDSLNHQGELPQKRLEDSVQTLRKLQERLESKGVHFLFLITPSKVTIYPEYIKDRYIIPQHSGKKSDYERIVPILRENGVHYLDGHRFLSAMKRRGPYPVYSSSGTHWSILSACYFTLELIFALEDLTKKPLSRFRIDRIDTMRKPIGSDNDLAKLANVLFEKSLYGKQYYYPETSPSVNVKNVFKPRMLFVGGSYLWTPFYYMEKHGVYSEREFYYYYKQSAKYPEQTYQPIDKKNLDLKREILRKDIVVVESNEQTLSQPGFGFIEDALRSLEES